MSNMPILDPLDKRLNLYNDKIAESDLKGKVSAENFIEGKPARIKVAFTDLRPNPDFSCGIDSQLKYGEQVLVYDNKDDWSWVKADRDGYVGWLETLTLDKQLTPPTHRICVPRTFFYPKPDMKLPHKGMRSMGSDLVIVENVENRGTHYAITQSGEAVIASHIVPIDQVVEDYVSVAEQLLYTPYLWGGTTAFGLDCSGLVQLCLAMAGRQVLKDSDMQGATLGTEIDAGENMENLKRGDLIFWRGHVAICQGDNMLIHANGHTMNVASEPLDEAVERIAYLYEKPIGFRRPQLTQNYLINSISIA